MKTFNFIFVAAALMITGILVCPRHAKAQNETMQGTDQEIRDEGYGNEDVEYYNAEDDVANVDEPSVEDNSAAKVQ